MRRTRWKVSVYVALIGAASLIYLSQTQVGLYLQQATYPSREMVVIQSGRQYNAPKVFACDRRDHRVGFMSTVTQISREILDREVFTESDILVLNDSSYFPDSCHRLWKSENDFAEWLQYHFRGTVFRVDSKNTPPPRTEQQNIAEISARLPERERHSDSVPPELESNDLPPYGEFCETRPRGEAQAWNLHKKVISFSLFLESPNNSTTLPPWLWNGLVSNVQQRSLYYPDWVIRIYTLNLNDAQVDSILELGKSHWYMNESGHVEVVRCHDDHLLNTLNINGMRMMTRFLAVDDPRVAYTIVRDVDSQFSPRELIATNEWLASGKGFHSMRDHSYHNIPIMGGMFGMKRGVLHPHNMTSLIREAFRGEPNLRRIRGCCGYDQSFLGRHVWPLVQSNTLAHDSRGEGHCKSHGKSECSSFPLGPRTDSFFVGLPFKDNNATNVHWNCSIQCEASFS